MVNKRIPESSFVFTYLRNVKRSFKGLPHHKSLSGILVNYSKFKKDVKFILIGANDGITNDATSIHIRANKWRGILVEPVPSIFQKLKENYLEFQDFLIFENAAIADQNGEATFYRLKESDQSTESWHNQLGSFNKDVVFKHRPKIPNFDNLFIEWRIRANCPHVFAANRSLLFTRN